MSMSNDIVYRCKHCNGTDISVSFPAWFELNGMSDEASESQGALEEIDYDGQRSYLCNDCECSETPSEVKFSDGVKVVTVQDLDDFEPLELPLMAAQGILDSSEMVNTVDSQVNNPARRDPETGDVWALLWIRVIMGLR